MPTGDQSAASRELTARISRLVWTGRVLSVLAGLAVAGLVVFFLLGNEAATTGAGAVPRRRSRASGNLIAVAVVGGFLVPLLAVRALFRWLLRVRRPKWIAELAEKHGVDADRLKRMADAIVELA
jgi:hypothetical protein